MRILFNSMTLPKKAAKRLQNKFDSIWDNKKLSECQALTARMLGYASWHELHKCTQPSNTPSPPDEAVSVEEQKDRLQYQSEVLLEHCAVARPDESYHWAEVVRVSSCDPESDRIENNLNISSRVVYHQESENKALTASYVASNRSEYCLEFSRTLDAWREGRIDFGEFHITLNEVLARQPENLGAIAVLLHAAVDADSVNLIKHRLLEFDRRIGAMLPADFLSNNEVLITWEYGDNHSLVRALLGLVRCYQQFPAATRWLKLLDQSGLIEKADVYLVAIRQEAALRFGDGTSACHECLHVFPSTDGAASCDHSYWEEDQKNKARMGEPVEEPDYVDCSSIYGKMGF